MKTPTGSENRNNWPAVDRRRPGWALDWQTAVEKDKAELARILHDETGGLLVAAIMDITSAEKGLPADAATARARLVRARAALDEAIKLNRRIIEELRPTLLENFGLVSALKWHFAEVCKTAAVHCKEQLPEHVDCAPVASIGLYRAAETLLSTLISYQPERMTLALEVHDARVTLEVTGSHLQRPYTRDDRETGSAIASVTARVRALGGELSTEEMASGLAVRCSVPVEQIRASGSSSAA